ncbi:MAG: radical SAM family heme chaperone HemW [Parvularculaceae bacterium]|nr:coproporphyrinogen III oxidase [Parvularculaceae bacterium]
MNSAREMEFGVYIHWPFCARICPYCDFNVYRDRGADTERFARAILTDLQYWAAQTGGRRLSSLYFGGGTPSLAPISVIASAIEACETFWGFAPRAEITLEANPTDAEIDRFRAFAAAGVNRISLGVQSFDDEALGFLGRDHDAATAMRAIETAQSVFARVNADFIYARPGQTLAAWERELNRAIATGLNHLSLYQLTIEPGTAFDRAVSKNRWAPADEDTAADLFDATQELTNAAGLPAYEISNHAAPGEASRHNFLYWRQCDYVGVGPGAHGRVTIGNVRHASETALRPNDYMELVENSGCGAALFDPLSDDEALTERLAMGLRTIEGIRLSQTQLRQLQGRIETLAQRGLISQDGERVFSTTHGRRILNAVLLELAP